MSEVTDRRQEILKTTQTSVTGIDYVFVREDQTHLDIHFLRAPSELADPLVNDLQDDQILIYSPYGAVDRPDMPVTIDGWDGEVLQLKTSRPGDFTLYNIYIDDQRIDPYFNNTPFSFKANCESDLDCKTPPHECPVEKVVDFPVDYRARDFWSFRRALLDFASQRYPDWADRLEADAAVMLAEVMSALGDEMAYYQDRIAREAYLETATQRRSLRRHARLVDYDTHDGRGAIAWLDVTVKAGESGQIAAGTKVWAESDGGRHIDFEVGRNLRDILAGTAYPVAAVCNAFAPYIWDEEDTCLPVGAASLYIQGAHEADLPKGKWVLLESIPAAKDLPVRRQLVRLTKSSNRKDVLLNEDITLLEWEAEQALPFEMDLRFLKVRGNIIPVSAGDKKEQLFVTGGFSDQSPIPKEKQADIPRAVERQGPAHLAADDAFPFQNWPAPSRDDATPTYLFTLPGSETTPLVWFGENIHRADPEIQLTEPEFDANSGVWKKGGHVWDWRRSLVRESSQSQDKDYTLDDGAWRRVAGYRRNGEEIVHEDYASGEGVTIRFGDGEFGLIPAAGTVFRVIYRLGGGKESNVPAGSLIHMEGIGGAYGFVEQVSNPLPATGGEDAERPATIRQLAPEAFRAVAFRAVTPDDYAEAVERLDGVQCAGAAFRWTGSWLSAFVTPDPKNAVTLSAEQRRKAVDQLDRFRQAGREAHVLDPRYADLDLEILICKEPYAYPGEVKALALEALFGKTGVRPRPGFFSPDRFTFGAPLRRSELEAAVQSVPGVLTVREIRYKRRGWSTSWQLFSQDAIYPEMDAIIRVANDPMHPEWGTVKILFPKPEES